MKQRSWMISGVWMWLVVFLVLATPSWAVQFGAGTGTSYPSAIDTINTRANKSGAACSSATSSYVCAEFTNDLQGAIAAIQAELGVLPKGGYATVVARLNAALYSGGALGTPSSGTGTNITGIPAANILAGSFGAGAYVISTSLQAATIELGHATDTTLARVSAGVASIEGATIATLSSANVFTANQTISSTAPSLILTDTTASAKSLTIAVDANIVNLRESAGASGSLLVLDLATLNVGIGTTGPGAPLEVRKDGASATIGGKIAINNFGAFSGQSVALDMSNANIGVNDPQVRIQAVDNSDWSSNLLFLTKTPGANSNSLAERMRITSAGNVGIGITPTTKLHAYGADNSTVGTFEIAATSANVTAADTFVDFRSSSGSIGTIAGTATSGLVAYNTFTGSHYTQVEEADRAALKIGMLLEATGDSLVPFTKQTRIRHVDEKRSKDDKGNDVVTPAQDIEEHFQAHTPSHLVRSRISRTKGSKAAYGVWGGMDKEGRDMVLALGTGMCIVARKTVNVEIGDYLMASDVTGSMEVQSGVVYQNSTVAKAMSPVVWQTGEQERTIPCIYLGG